MTEAEWLACRTPRQMLRSLGKRVAGRKKQLFLLGIGRLLWDHLSAPMRELVVLNEQFADGEVDVNDFQERQAAGVAEIAAPILNNHPRASVDSAVLSVMEAVLSYQLNNAIRAGLEWGERAIVLAAPERLRPQAASDFQSDCSHILRELFPSLRRQYVVQPDFVGGGLLLPDGTTFHVPEVARSLALGVQHDQAFDRLPILADALEDANCADRPLLDHLRHGTHHRRGCWALDLVLGRG